MKKLLVLCSILLVFVSFTGCFEKKAVNTKQTEGSQAKENVFTFAIDEVPSIFDPRKAASTFENLINAQTSEPLLKYDYKTMEPMAGIAKSWDIKNDGKTFTFHLRNDVKFSNGKPVTANDFKYSFEKTIEPDTTTSYILAPVLGADEKLSGKAKETKGIKVVDDYTLEITLEKSNCNFLSALASYMLVIFDKNEVEKQGKEFGKTGISGVGPFKYLSSNENEVVLVKNNDYYNRKPYIDKVRFVKMSREKAWEEYNKGNVDFSFFVPNARVNMKDPKYKDHIKIVPQLATAMITLNPQKEPFKSNSKLREAVSCAINRKYLVDTVLNDFSGVAANAIVPPVLLGQSEGDKIVSYDKEKVKALLAEAGFPEGKGLPELNLTYFDRGNQKQIVESIKKDLEAFNMKVKLILIDKPDSPIPFKRDVTDLCRIAYGPDYLDIDSYIQPLLHSKGAFNITGYTNKEVDKLFDKASITQSFAERKNLFREAENLILKDYYCMPLYWNQMAIITSPRVKSYQMTPMEILPCDSVMMDN
jgi:ABC-type transport system substrate-binding protein